MPLKDTLYLKIERNTEVHTTEVRLGDVAKLECSNKDVVNRLKAMKILTLSDAKRYSRNAVSVLKVIEQIHSIYPQLEINNVGETDFVVAYEKEPHQHKVMDFLKTLLVCLTTFFGAAFSIMSFNNDVQLTKLFSQIYMLMTGETSNGYTILELSYSIGLTVGVVIFFNHFGGRKLSVDPTPIEVEMRLYEDDVNTTVIEDSSRKGKNVDVN